MQFEILGPLRVLDEGVELDVGGPKQQRVLAMLLAADGTALSADQLIEGVWAEKAPATATHVLRTYVSALRASLAERLESDGTHYALDTTNDDVDAEHLVDLHERALAVRSSDPAGGITLLDEAESLWRGRPFGDLWDTAPLVSARCTELEEWRLIITETRCSIALDMGAAEQAIPPLYALTAQHPYREHAHRLLMLALYRTDRQAEALRVAEGLRIRLVDDLGIDPSSDTSDLEIAILRQDPGLLLPPRSTLPAFASSFVGRGLELAEVVKTLDISRVVTLTGPGGAGKTRLAVEAATVSRSAYPDGVWWVDFSTALPDQPTAPHISDAFGLAVPPDADPLDATRRFLANRAALIVLDNCEHVVDDLRPSIGTLLRDVPALSVLATSRRPIAVPGEHIYPVPPLSLPVEAEGGSDAEHLFIERASALDPAVFASTGASSAIAEICRTLEGHPLSIELAATKVTTSDVAGIAEELPDRLDGLSSPATESRHSSVRASIEWSYELLTTDEQDLFARLGAFTGSFERDAAVAAGNRLDSGTAFDRLVEASMVAKERSADGVLQFRLLGIMRRFALDRLEVAGRLTDARRAHASFHLDLVAESGALSYSSAYGPALMRLIRARADLTAALDFALTDAPELLTREVLQGLMHVWFATGAAGTARAYGTRLRGVVEPGSEAEAVATMIYAFGEQLAGDPQAAYRALSEALPRLEAAGDWRTLLLAYSGQGAGGVMAGIEGLCREMGLRILELCDAQGLDAPRAYGLVLLGQEELFHDGDLEAAVSALEEAAPLLRQLGDETALNMFCLGPLASAHAELGNLDAAAETAQEASRFGGPGWSATPLIVMAEWVCLTRGDLDEAEEVALAALDRVHERSLEAWTRPCLLVLGRIAADRSDWTRAAQLHGAARPHLPWWATKPRFWDRETAVIDALGRPDYERLAAIGAETPLDDLVEDLIRAR